tara:strand:+ start:1027 stop:1164 length:138 start_codon:yes stop_codon:yes gene_type:complete
MLQAQRKELLLVSLFDLDQKTNTNVEILKNIEGKAKDDDDNTQTP